MRRLLLLAAAYAAAPLLLIGCFDAEPAESEPHEARPVKMNWPAEMRGCKAFHVPDEHGYTVLVTRCPNSTATTQAGKAGATVVADEADEPPEE